MIRVILLLGLTATCSSCGYTLLQPGVGGGATILVPPTENSTRWRGVEVQFTEAVRSNLQQLLQLRFSNQNPDLVLQSSLKEVYRGAPVRGRTGGAIIGTATVVLQWTLTDSQGDSVAGGTLEQTLEYLPSGDEDGIQAIEEILDWMAESVVIKVHAGLDSAAN